MSKKLCDSCSNTPRALTDKLMYFTSEKRCSWCLIKSLYFMIIIIIIIRMIIIMIQV